MSRYPQARVKVFVLWAPFLSRDNLQTAQRASVYMTDPRFEHFWDVWRYASRTYVDQLRLPELDAWDMFTFYKPHLVWNDEAPYPTFWMQNRNLSIGRPYNKADLEAELKNWIQ